MTPQENLTWGLNLTKVTNTKHKSTLLRTAHGEIYTKEKLARFGLIESPECPRCNEVETLRHKLIECAYVNRIWVTVFNYTDRLKLARLGPTHVDVGQENKILGATIDTNPAILAIHAEIIQRILSLKDDATFLLRPITMVRQAIKLIRALEKNENIKEELNQLLND